VFRLTLYWKHQPHSSHATSLQFILAHRSPHFYFIRTDISLKGPEGKTYPYLVIRTFPQHTKTKEKDTPHSQISQSSHRHETKPNEKAHQLSKMGGGNVRYHTHSPPLPLQQKHHLPSPPLPTQTHILIHSSYLD
jgi:hypothetical protein